MSEQFLVKHCSPTLAGIKMANLFRYQYDTLEELHDRLLEYNKQLNSKGLYIDLLKIADGYALVYVYRKNKLEAVLKRQETVDFLNQYGYSEYHMEYCISRLKERMKIQKDFPHEIGLFLGYPLEDVIGFIENAGQNSKYTGSWKVYYNENDKVKLFHKFDQCETIYARLHQGGRSMMQLTVPA